MNGKKKNAWKAKVFWLLATLTGYKMLISNFIRAINYKTIS